MISKLSSKVTDVLDHVNQLESNSRFTDTCDIHLRDHVLDNQLSTNVNVDRAYNAETHSFYSTTTESQHSIPTNSPLQHSIAAECDVLILSDSMLKRIQSRRFSPNGKTITRYIRGGAKACVKFVDNKSHKCFGSSSYITCDCFSIWTEAS